MDARDTIPERVSRMPATPWTDARILGGSAPGSESWISRQGVVVAVGRHDGWTAEVFATAVAFQERFFDSRVIVA